LCLLINFMTHYTILHQLVLELKVFLFVMMWRGAHGGGNQHETIDDVYESEEVARDEQLTTHLQCLEEQFDRFSDEI